MTQQQMDPKTAARYQAAALQEQEAQAQYLQSRVVALNVEVQVRDELIADLEGQLQAARDEVDALHAAAEGPGGASGEPSDA